MDDRDIYDRIRALVAQEHDLREDEAADPEHAEARTGTLRRIEESLDQCWDLLRQRRALRESGADPSAAHQRGIGEVEGYIQ